MKYVKKYEKVEKAKIDIDNYNPHYFKPKVGTYWFIEGDVKDVYNILKNISNNFLTMTDSDDMERTIFRLEMYLDTKSTGLFIYYSKFGFSFSIIEDKNQMIDLYKNQKEAGIYEYVGELTIDEKQITFDNRNKIFLEDIIKYNL